MDAITITRIFTGGIPVIVFVALAVSVFLFVKNKGTMDALNSAVETYRSLAEGYKDTVEQLEDKHDRLEAEIRELKQTMAVQKEAMGMAVDELIAGFTRSGFCAKAKTCRQFSSTEEK